MVMQTRSVERNFSSAAERSCAGEEEADVEGALGNVFDDNGEVTPAVGNGGGTRRDLLFPDGPPLRRPAPPCAAPAELLPEMPPSSNVVVSTTTLARSARGLRRISAHDQITPLVAISARTIALPFAFAAVVGAAAAAAAAAAVGGAFTQHANSADVARRRYCSASRTTAPEPHARNATQRQIAWSSGGEASHACAVYAPKQLI